MNDPVPEGMPQEAKVDISKRVYDWSEGSAVAKQDAAFREQYVKHVMVANPLIEVIYA